MYSQADSPVKPFEARIFNENKCSRGAKIYFQQKTIFYAMKLVLILCTTHIKNNLKRYTQIAVLVEVV